MGAESNDRIAACGRLPDFALAAVHALVVRVGVVVQALDLEHDDARAAIFTHRRDDGAERLL